MPELGVNIDHVATVRQARRTNEPDPVWAAALAELERINPDFTVEQLESRNLVGVPYRSRVVAAARKAGMKSQEAE